MNLLPLYLILSFISPLSAEEVSVTVDKKTLQGELNLTEKNTSRIAFIISGSGPTDRDGNTVGAPGKSNSLKYLSEYLNKGGISTLRVDKRGVGASASAASKEADLRFSTYVEDIGYWIALLKQKGFSKIILIGHSEGALVATLAAQHESVVGLVSIAGAGKPATAILKNQLKPKLPKELYKEADKIIDTLAEGQTVKDFPPSLISLFRPSVQPYLISWFQLDPAKAISGLGIPVLVVQGSTDLQTSPEDAKLLHAAAEISEMEIIEGMNHVLKEVKGDIEDQLSSYFNSQLPLHKDVGEVILKFALKLKIEQLDEHQSPVH